MNKNNEGAVTAIILAAGSGRRMNSDKTKQRMTLLGRSVILRTTQTFYNSDAVDNIVVVGRADELEYLRAELAPCLSKIHAIVAGGETRQSSARIGFENIPRDTALVAIHDGARCLITEKVIKSVIERARITSAATAAVPIYDTVKRVDAHGTVIATEDRDSLVLAQTPQVFSVDVYRRALNASADIDGVTDDNMLVENIGGEVHTVISEDANPKITTAQDLEYAEFLLKGRGEDV